MSANDLALALNGLAVALRSISTASIGAVGIAINDGRNQKAGGITAGIVAAAIGGPGSGSVTGFSAVAGDAGSHERIASVLRDVEAVADAAKTGAPPPAWVESVLARAKDLGHKALDTALTAAINAAAKLYGA